LLTSAIDIGHAGRVSGLYSGVRCAGYPTRPATIRRPEQRPADQSGRWATRVQLDRTRRSQGVTGWAPRGCEHQRSVGWHAAHPTSQAKFAVYLPLLLGPVSRGPFVVSFSGREAPDANPGTGPRRSHVREQPCNFSLCTIDTQTYPSRGGRSNANFPVSSMFSARRGALARLRDAVYQTSSTKADHPAQPRPEHRPVHCPPSPLSPPPCERAHQKPRP